MQTPLKTAAIIPAAGQGRRMGSSVSKQFLELRGQSILERTVEVFLQEPWVGTVVLVVPEPDVPAAKKEWAATPSHKGPKVVAGGIKRQDSVANGLAALDPDTDIVVVHDGVRPFVTSEMIRSSINAANEHGAAVCAIPVNDTLKRVDPGGWITDGVDRDGLWRMQTPQTFRYSLLLKAFQKATSDAFTGTDETSLVERLGEKVHIVSGSERNIKITRPEDLILAEAFLDAKG